MQGEKGIINEQSIQDKSYVNKDSNINLLTVKNKHEVDYCIAGPSKEVSIAASALITCEMHSDYTDILSRIGCLSKGADYGVVLLKVLVASCRFSLY